MDFALGVNWTFLKLVHFNFAIRNPQFEIVILPRVHPSLE